MMNKAEVYTTAVDMVSVTTMSTAVSLLGGPLKAMLAAATSVAIVAVVMIFVLMMYGVYSAPVSTVIVYTALVLEAIYLIVDCF